jgi:uncharacterized repeat protein (TIGR01451 family)
MNCVPLLPNPDRCPRIPAETQARGRWRLLALAGLLGLLGGVGTLRRWDVHSSASTVEPASASQQTHAPGTALFYTTAISIPTYPYTNHLSSAHDPFYNVTYPVLDWGSYNPSATRSVTYELLVLENDYLQVTLLPQLGGRVYQMIFKPTSSNELYQNPVIKPTHWGPAEQGWWLAVGGIEWCLPVEEHGYEWGQPWSWSAVTTTAGVTVTLRDTAASDRIRAAIAVFLPSDRGYLALTPRIENPTAGPIAYKYWSNAMLAPGLANTVGPDLRFVFNAAQVTVHSTNDSDLPKPGQPMTWPIYSDTDYSRLGNWNTWLGFFERPQAAADFAGVYDTAVDEGVARVFPASVARGSKGFGMGWAHSIDPLTWTDGGSTYVELHGGVAPTFWDTATLAAGRTLEWTEYWYPVSGVGSLSAATPEAALGVRESDGYFQAGVHSTLPRAAGMSTLHALDRATRAEIARWELPAIAPGAPFTASLETGGRALADVAFVYLDAGGRLLAAVNFPTVPSPAAAVAPLPAWVATTAFSVTWIGQNAWAGFTTYDVQTRDGYEGAWSDWLSDTVTTSAVFTGTHGHTAFFRARARDPWGNDEPFGDEEWGQAFTTVLTEPAAVLVTSHKQVETPLFRPDEIVTYTVNIRNTGNLTAAAALTDTPPLDMRVLTETLGATSGFTPTYDGVSIHWTGAVTPGTGVSVTYVLFPAAMTPAGVPLTNTVEIAGSVLGPFTRRAVVTRMCLVWMPMILRGWPP